MGTMAQVLIEDTGIFLFQHYDGWNIVDAVRKALRRRERWEQPDYLARIIFSEMLLRNKAVEDSEGFGISRSPREDIEYFVSINAQSRMMSVHTLAGDSFFGSFEEFISSNMQAVVA